MSLHTTQYNSSQTVTQRRECRYPSSSSHQLEGPISHTTFQPQQPASFIPSRPVIWTDSFVDAFTSVERKTTRASWYTSGDYTMDEDEDIDGKNFLFGSMFGVWNSRVFNHGQVLPAVLVRITGSGPGYIRPGRWYRAYFLGYLAKIFLEMFSDRWRDDDARCRVLCVTVRVLLY